MMALAFFGCPGCIHTRASVRRRTSIAEKCAGASRRVSRGAEPPARPREAGTLGRVNLDSFTDWIDPSFLIKTFGLIGIFGIIFAETGLLIGFFLPGDSLLFAAGVFTTPEAAKALGIEPLPLPALLIGCPFFAIVGAQLGHYLGARFGRRLFERPNSRFFRPEYVQRAEYYFEKFGPARAVVLARFIPIVRTFLNPVAGMLGMSSRRFFVWNVVGAIVWCESILLVGHFLAGAIPDIDRYILPAIAVIVVLSVIPIIREIRKARRYDPKAEGEDPPQASLTGDSSR
jgi:membrane-associated protein